MIILETAYPWTSVSGDSSRNIFGGQARLNGYPFTSKGQFELLIKLTEEVLAGGGNGIIYWEPAWISSSMKDPWGTGSSWENCTFFDFDGNSIEGINFMNYGYD